MFAKRKIETMYCVKNFTYNIEGTFLHDKYSFLIFDFYQCVNSTKNNNKCKPQEDIDYYLNGTFVSVEFTDISLDQSNYSYPDSPILGETYSTISKNFYREMHIFLKSVLFRSDRVDVYERTNIKFQTTLANIGGILKAVTTIRMIVTYFYSQTKYDE